MSRKLLLVFALIMLGTAVAANAASVSHKQAGPPPNCRLHPNDPRCRAN